MTEFTKLELLLLFTPDERAAIRQAAVTNSTVADILMLWENAVTADSSNPFINAAMGLFFQLGYLTEERYNAIVSTLHPTVVASNGTVTIGDTVNLLPPFDNGITEHTIKGFDTTGAIFIEGFDGSFDVSYIRKV